MTLSEAKELLDYWRLHPPVHLLVAAALGADEQRAREQNFAALMALAPGGFLKAKGKA